MRTIGLTGGIGSGKSTVAGMLRDLGIPVLDADAEARALVEPGEEGLQEIVVWLGPSILLPDGRLDRAKLARLIFSDPEKRLKLNSIMHPRIRERLLAKLEEVRASGAETVVLDIPLLFETGAKYPFSEVWVVWAPRAERIRRLHLRDGLDMREIEARFSAQMPLEEKLALADRVIDNGGSLSETERQVREFVEHPYTTKSWDGGSV